MSSPITTVDQAKVSLLVAWPSIVEECLGVLGSELHYQAMIYYGLRTFGGISTSQLGMNVKMWIENPVSQTFKELDQKKHPDYRGGFEPIPDVVIFGPEIRSDWRRRNAKQSLCNTLIAIEVKASERAGSRLGPKEVSTDIEKLAAQREEAQHRGGDMYPVMMVIDSAPLPKERMTEYAVASCVRLAAELDVGMLYCARDRRINTVK